MLDEWRAASSGPPPGPVLAVDDLAVQVRTPTGWRTVVDRVSLNVAPGETLGIVGASGSGKTMTSLASLGLLPAVARESSGTVKMGDPALVGAEPRLIRQMRGPRMAMTFHEQTSTSKPRPAQGVPSG